MFFGKYEEKYNLFIQTKSETKWIDGRYCMANIYTCKTCGLVMEEKGHLCNPIPAKKVVACKYCGTTTGDPRHVCSPKLVSLKYICDSCGRLAAKREMLCRPSPLQIPKKPAVKKTGKSKKSKK
ncbi:MAG: hypothetical protein DCC43_15710 [Candidatus Brocadia sp.]|nr:hypothetical protein [Candidatus Brocadia sp. AMX3]OQY98647.1 MAG: hypothetical protein B6D35_11515 [Candidatus Brocadia sp. UTAMX2]RIJ88882.1 MAG: hypothetical protein DCC43_15710 [Candidatus Brocadia sp.]